MTDQEIVRAAAEARGFPCCAEKGIPYVTYHSEGRVLLNYANGTAKVWNPLTSDADAMGLVDDLVQDRFEVSIKTYNELQYWECFVRKLRMNKPQGSACDPDRRRAITLAYLRTKGVAA